LKLVLLWRPIFLKLLVLGKKIFEKIAEAIRPIITGND